jgi:SHAQKYF class myb-like DNA-binding protein
MVKGTWYEDEHDKFVSGLAMYGRDLAKVQVLVGSRTLPQVHSHAQKYFLKQKDLAQAPMREKLIKWKLSGCTIAVTPVMVIDTRLEVARELEFPAPAPAPSDALDQFAGAPPTPAAPTPAAPTPAPTPAAQPPAAQPPAAQPPAAPTPAAPTPAAPPAAPTPAAPTPAAPPAAAEAAARDFAAAPAAPAAPPGSPGPPAPEVAPRPKRGLETSEAEARVAAAPAKRARLEFNMCEMLFDAAGAGDAWEQIAVRVGGDLGELRRLIDAAGVLEGHGAPPDAVKRLRATLAKYGG